VFEALPVSGGSCRRGAVDIAQAFESNECSIIRFVATVSQVRREERAMGSVAQAVLEFDEAVQVPWRPPLAGRPVLLQAVPSTGGHRPHATRAARLTVPDSPPIATPASRPVMPRGSAGGSTASGHTCVACSGAVEPVSVRRTPPVRLTRRARWLLGVVGSAGAVLFAVWIGSVVGGADEGLVLVSDSSVVVHEGDTLWGIARSVAGDQDVRAVVDEIQQVNGLDDAALVPGQVLRLP
jgi:nucleoid-associated protein YgaU